MDPRVLSNRTFKVLVNGQLSSEAKVTTGCPQGTILGCLSYILYTNSIKDIIPTGVAVKIYADDTKIYAKVNNDEDFMLLQEAINRFYEWTLSLDLLLSVGKCNVVHFGRRNQFREYFINNTKLLKTDTIRDLGVILTTDFKFSEQTREVVNKASRRSNWILRSFAIKDIDVYIRLFDTYVLFILTYGSPIWNPYLRKDKLLLQSVYNKFSRKLAFKCGTVAL